MPEDATSSDLTVRVRFAPSPTGFLHVGSARTFIFNWLYARHHNGIIVLRLDDTDVERNTDASVQSIFEGLGWLGLDWDEAYKQSERLALHRSAAHAIFEKGLAYRDFTPAHAAEGEASSAQGAWLSNPGMRELSREDSDRRAATGELFALRYRVPRGQTQITPVRCTSETASTASSRSWPMKWKTLRCCDLMACRPTTWPPAWTTPTCGSPTSSAGRTT